MVEMYKICCGFYDRNVTAGLFERNDRDSRGNAYKVVVRKANLEMRKNFFAIRAPLDWNNLPQETVQSKTIDEFKWKQKVKSIIVTEVTVISPFIMYSSQNPWNFFDMEVIMIKEDDKCLSPFQLKSIPVTFLQ